jgi:hypothetical protein
LLLAKLKEIFRQSVSQPVSKAMFDRAINFWVTVEGRLWALWIETPAHLRTSMKNDEIRGFRIEVAPEILSDLRQRLTNTRSYQVEGRIRAIYILTNPDKLSHVPELRG